MQMRCLAPRLKSEILMLLNDDWMIMTARDTEARNRSTDLNFKLWLSWDNIEDVCVVGGVGVRLLGVNH